MNLYTHVLELVPRQLSGFIACPVCKSLASPGESIFDQKWPLVQPGLVALVIRAWAFPFTFQTMESVYGFRKRALWLRSVTSYLDMTPSPLKLLFV